MNIVVGDSGTVIEITVHDQAGDIVNISAATVMKIKFTLPDATHVDKTAVFSTNGVDGKLRYTTVTGDIVLAGVWMARGYVELGASPKFHTSEISFTVVPV